MDLARGPDPTPTLDRTAPPVGAVPDARDAALARLPADERRSLTGLTRTVEAHFDAIRAGGTVPAGFDGLVRAYDAAHRIGGVPVSPDYADVRATIEAQRLAAPGLAAPGLAVPGALGTAETRQSPDAQPTAAQIPSVDARRDATEPTREPDPEVVRQALADFRDVLSRGPDVAVTKADLDRLTENVRARTPEDMRAVCLELSIPERERWAAELAANYSPAERSELYGLLVERFDDQALLTFGYYHHHAGSDGTDGRLLGEAVARHAPEAVTELFIRGAACYTVPAAQRGALSERTSDFEARPELGVAAAAALAGLHGPALDRTLGELHDAFVLDDVVGRAVMIQNVPIYGREEGIQLDVPTVNADLLRHLLHTASGSHSDLATASLVNAASKQLMRLEGLPSTLEALPDTVDRAESVSRVRNGITEMLRRDPVGVLQNYSETVAPDGQGALTDYVGSMLRSGQTGTLRDIVADLSTGGGTAASSADWASQEFPNPGGGSTPYLMNAKTLAFTVGSIGRAINAASASATERGEMVKQIFGTATDLAAAPAPQASFLWSLADRAFGALVDRRTEGVVEGNDALLDDLTRRSTPTYASGDPVRGGTLDFYEDRLGRTLSGPAGPGERNQSSPPSPTRP